MSFEPSNCVQSLKHFHDKFINFYAQNILLRRHIAPVVHPQYVCLILYFDTVLPCVDAESKFDGQGQMMQGQQLTEMGLEPD